MTSFLIPVTNYTRVAGDEKRDVVFAYSKARGHRSEIVLFEKVPIDDPMEIEEEGSKTKTEDEPVFYDSGALPHEVHSANSIIDPEEAEKIAGVMRQTELNYLNSMVKNLHVKEETIKVDETKNLTLEIIPFRAIVLRDPTTGTIVQMSPYPYPQTKMVKVFVNDYSSSITKYESMFSEQPKVVSHDNNLYEIWEVPYEYDPIITYKTEIIYVAELLEARAVANFYGVVPIVLHRGETEMWIVPSSLPIPKTKEKFVKIPKQSIEIYINIFNQRFCQNPKVIDTSDKDSDVWVVPLSF